MLQALPLTQGGGWLIALIRFILDLYWRVPADLVLVIGSELSEGDL